MKKRKTSPDSQKVHTLSIPDIEIIDLDNDGIADIPDRYPVPASRKDTGKRRDGSHSRVNIHIVLLIVFLLFVAGIIYKIMNYGVHVDLSEIFKDGPGTYEDNFDIILPLVDSEGNPLYKNYGEGSSILVFGNAPFADDRGSRDNLASMIQEMTGATVYNCAVSGSYLAAESSELDGQAHPMDIFNFYWLCSLATGYHDFTDAEFQKGMAVLGDSAPPEANEVYNTLKSIDLNTVDVVVAMYDGSDYLDGHPMYNDGNSTDITQFTGNTEAGIELLNYCYPNIRIIIMSPPYAYGLDENGNYISSDIQRYGWDVLSTYVIKQYASCSSRMVTFVDNLYGTINEDQAPDYLTDHLHLNLAGRKKVAERFVHALNYFSHMVK
ncbi:MAG TPA: hypothetical protein DCZ91_13290 [Lachnospiraceae bacterium]|nr:hypothetical protein [Lachnospiraceae bacterium]